MNKLRGHFLFTVMLAVCGAFPVFATAGEKPGIVVGGEAYKKAEEVAAGIGDQEIIEMYRHNNFYPQFQPALNKWLGECYKSLSTPSTEAVSFVVTLDTEGRVQQIAIDKKTNMIDCIAPHLLKLRFLPPPFAPMAEKIDLQLEQSK